MSGASMGVRKHVSEWGSVRWNKPGNPLLHSFRTGQIKMGVGRLTVCLGRKHKCVHVLLPLRVCCYVTLVTVFMQFHSQQQHV